MGMRHVRILNLFISSILPTSIKIQRKSITTCLGCGRFQSTSRLLFPVNNLDSFSEFLTVHPSIQKRHYITNKFKFGAAAAAAATKVSTKKYANIHGKCRPAEPSIAINKLSTLGRPNEALAVYLKLLGEGGFPSRESLYQLIRALYKSSNLLGMYTMHDALLSHYSRKRLSNKSARAMIYMYTMLIQLVAKTTRPVDMNTIQQLCNEMSHFPGSGSSNIVLYNILIKTLLNQGQLSTAKTMFDDLIKRNIKPTIITFGILLKDASRRKDIPRMLNYLDEMEQYSYIIPDYAIVSILVTTLCDVHEFDKAKGMVEKLHRIVAGKDLVGIKFRNQLLQSIEYKRNRIL